MIGELACGHMRNRRQILGLLAALPRAPVVEDGELLHLIERHRLHGCGLGWADIHLLGSALLGPCALWTSDRALRDAARALGVAADQRA